MMYFGYYITVYVAEGKDDNILIHTHTFTLTYVPINMLVILVYCNMLLCTNKPPVRSQ